MTFTRYLTIGILLAVLGGCFILTGMGTRDDWDVAGNIDCYQLRIDGDQNNTPTNVTETAGVVTIDGDVKANAYTFPNGEEINNDTDGLITITGGIWALGPGKILSGANDTTAGGLWIYGPSTGTGSGNIYIFTSAEHDHTVDFFKIEPYEDDLRIGPNTDADAVVLKDDGKLDLTAGLKLAGVAVTSTAAELNILDGVTATASEINILDGVTANATELNYIDGSTPGTAVASKALVLGASKNVDTLTVTGDFTGTTLTGTNAYVLDTIETHDLIASGDVKGSAFYIAGTQVTSTAAELNILDGVTANATELNLLDGKTFVSCSPLVYQRDNIVASESLVPVFYHNETTGIGEVTLPWAGSITAISININAVAEEGTLTVYPANLATGEIIHANCKAQLAAAQTTAYAKFNAGLYPVTAGLRLGLWHSTTANWTPETSDIIVTVWYAY